jgi:tRNA(Arg) A34 adenosine deaminase TadA
MDDLTHMETALAEAKAAYTAGEVPVGAVVVAEDGTVLAKAHNLVETAKDASQHAELIAMRAATKVTGEKFLTSCTLYVTLEPCAMCAQAAAWLRIHRIVFGASDPKSGGLISGPNVLAHSHHKPEVKEGLLAEACATLMQNFFKERR